jgi:hypothetical protein
MNSLGQIRADGGLKVMNVGQTEQPRLRCMLQFQLQIREASDDGIKDEAVLTQILFAIHQGLRQGGIFAGMSSM